jgi:rod shape-determining protein MreC
MINLLAILQRFHVQLLFVVLMIIGLLITIQQKNYQKVAFVNSANSISGGTISTYSDLSYYFDLKEVNDVLAKENALLRSQYPNSLRKISGGDIQVNDTIYKQKYIYKVATVVGNTVTRRNNYITINLGEKDSIKPEMGVISSEGVVGVVKSVSENYATVLSFLHPNSSISCRMKSNGVTGILQWTKDEIDEAYIKGVLVTTKVNNGDSIVTSGLSFLFPAGLYLGNIISVEDDLETQSQNIKVKLDIQFNSLRKVYVVENLFRKEVVELQNNQNKLDGK